MSIFKIDKMTEEKAQSVNNGVELIMI